MNLAVNQRLHNSGEALGPNSRSEFARSQGLTPGGSMRAAVYFAPHPPYAARGKGAYVTDIDGRRIFDCANNFFSLVHGHGFGPVKDALLAAIEGGTAFGLPTPSESELVEEIRGRSPELEHLRFMSSGTEAVMFAIKAARAITGRSAIAKFEGAYHGAYDYAEVSLDSTAQNWGEREPASILYARGTPASVAEDTLVLPFADPKTCREVIAKNHTRLAAILFDPLSSRVAMAPASQDILEVLSEACRTYGILLISDEVVSYRLGFGGAYNRFGFKPDLVALGKIIGGGLPIGAVGGSAEHMAIFDHTKGKPPVSHGGTFSANPLAMASGLAALKAYDQAAVDRLNAMGDAFRQKLDERLRQAGVDAQVNGCGSLFRILFTREPIVDFRTASRSADKQRLGELHFALLERGYLLTPNCSGAFSTPMTGQDLEDLSEAIVESFSEIA